MWHLKIKSHRNSYKYFVRNFEILLLLMLLLTSLWSSGVIFGSCTEKVKLVEMSWPITIARGNISTRQTENN